MRMQGWLLHIILIIIVISEWTQSAYAAKFIRNKAFKTCINLPSPTTSDSCSPISTTLCPTDRFSNVSSSSSIQWHTVIISSPSSTNSTQFKITSTAAYSQTKLCLTATANGVQACTCDDTSIAQLWTGNAGQVKTQGGNCLVGTAAGINTGGSVGVGVGLCGGESAQWDIYHTTPGSVTLYTTSYFFSSPMNLLQAPYTSQSLPSSIFSTPFSLEIPPGFEFVVQPGNNATIVFSSDTPQVDPISDLTTSFQVRLKDGVIVYEQPAYFGVSWFLSSGFGNDSNNTTNQNATKIVGTTGNSFSFDFGVGSVMVKDGFKAVIWDSKSKNGDNFGLFETVANFGGVMTATARKDVQSADISAAECTPECASGGFCSGKNVCTCSPGFTGALCDQCLPGFFGPTCQPCSQNCPNTQNQICSDGLTGTGECKCLPNFAGPNCTTCAPGFFGPSCKPCNCNNGTCDSNGVCSCLAGWITPQNSTAQCSECKPGYFLLGDSCKSCGPGCQQCDSNGNCLKCFGGLGVPPDNPKVCKVVSQPSCPDGQFFDGTVCTQCDQNCQTCYGPGPGACLACPQASSLLENQCREVGPTDGICSPLATTGIASNWVANSANGVCDPCPSSCLACSIPSSTNNTASLVCTKCMTGFVLDGVKCVKTCSQGKFVNPADNMTCIPCDSSCATCKGAAPNQCLTCANPSQFALNGSCSATPCPTGFVSVNTACTKCHPDCTECSGPGVNQCTKCPANRPIMTRDNQCVEVCPMGMYADANAKCQTCDGSCSSCVGPRNDQCLGCSNKDKVLIGGSCSGTCPSGSTLLQSERLCGTSNGLAAPIPSAPVSSKSLPWWAVLLIVLAALIFIGLGTYLVRYYALKRRQKKIEEFGDQLDEQAVAENMQQLQAGYESTPSRIPSSALSEPQTSYQPFANNLLKQKESEQELEKESYPPAYDPRDGEEYWKRLQRQNSKLSRKASILSRFGDSRKKDDWEGFEEVTLGDKGVVRSGASSSNGKDKAQGDKRPGSISIWGENWI